MGSWSTSPTATAGRRTRPTACPTAASRSTTRRRRLKGNDVRFNSGGMQLDGSSRNVSQQRRRRHEWDRHRARRRLPGERARGQHGRRHGAQGIYVADDATDPLGEPVPGLGNLLIANSAEREQGRRDRGRQGRPRRHRQRHARQPRLGHQRRPGRHTTAAATWPPATAARAVHGRRVQGGIGPARDLDGRADRRPPPATHRPPSPSPPTSPPRSPARSKVGRSSRAARHGPTPA